MRATVYTQIALVQRVYFFNHRVVEDYLKYCLLLAYGFYKIHCYILPGYQKTPESSRKVKRSSYEFTWILVFGWFWPYAGQLGKWPALSLDLGVSWDTLPWSTYMDREQMSCWRGVIAQWTSQHHFQPFLSGETAQQESCNSSPGAVLRAITAPFFF